MESAEESKHKRQFDAAIRVIQSLPKNGSFKPSNELMLKLYGYYKQATLGECKTSKPSFWDPVGKAKWEAWNSLGSMSADEAMEGYVAELKQIAEVMPQTEEVNGLVKELGHFYELADIHTGETVSVEQALSVYPDSNKLSNHSSPTVSNGHVPGYHGNEYVSPAHESDRYRTSSDMNGEDLINEHNKPLAGDSNGAMIDQQRASAPDLVSSDQAEGRLSPLSGDSDTDSEVYVDSSDLVISSPYLNDSPVHEKTVDLLASCPTTSTHDAPDNSSHHPQPAISSSNGRAQYSQSQNGPEEPVTRPKVPNTKSNKLTVSFLLPERSPPESPEPAASSRTEEINEKLRMALLNMQQEIKSLEKRLSLVEQITVRQRKRELEGNQNALIRWWPFPGLRPQTALAMLLWPLLVGWFMRYLAARRRHRH